MFKKKQKKKTGGAIRFESEPQGREHVAEQYRDEQHIRAPPASAAPPPTMDETEQILLNLHSNLIDFYSKHKPENIDEDVLTILMQFFIDAGADALNSKLEAKYGENLRTFKTQDEPVPPPPNGNFQGTLERVKKRQDEKDLLQRTLPPPPKKQAPKYSPQPPAAPKPNGLDRDPSILQDEDSLDIDIEIDMLEENPAFCLYVLDKPEDAEVSPRDLIEAFYARHDEKKLETDVIEKFVLWVEQHSLQGLDDKLKTKYGEGLDGIKQLARRRRNLENKLTEFYCEHDMAKLQTRWSILKIINWTMDHGLPALNKKFETRYGIPVVPLK
mmetsp:Transcript_5564/g.6463  ORF Transcript_5564/g.6463 Transcript_5564/m.6463 type:complete len:328 (-) Transcript_5564:705-1688(-)|eukprot:CAMPEP_0184016362 /NCGR_PEP_ID=MMETSP0954-20121128/6888_1 /TAXON_ID=627963 /ORGANISM="Aplanochytrium sp, Strain PBS07" /LENGTH=327 /DNA_ID=CAMNT_0026297377 /DNA_START=364 /DNA_END=1347 /DNA_ORIENTATION=+